MGHVDEYDTAVAQGDPMKAFKDINEPAPTLLICARVRERETDRRTDRQRERESVCVCVCRFDWYCSKIVGENPIESSSSDRMLAKYRQRSLANSGRGARSDLSG